MKALCRIFTPQVTSILYITLLVAPVVAAPHEAMCELFVFNQFRLQYTIGVCTVVFMNIFGRAWTTQRYLVFPGFTVFLMSFIITFLRIAPV